MTHEITAIQGTIPTAFYTQLRTDWGYRQASPQISVPVTIQGLSYELLGLDPFAVPLSQVTNAALPSEVLSKLLTQANTVILPQSLAQRLNITAGQSVSVQLQQQPISLSVLATVPMQANTENLLFADIATAESLAARKGLTRIQLQLSETQAQQLQALLPATLKLEAFAQRQAVFGQMTQAFSTNLLAMSLLAMLVGAFLVYNTMTFSVLQRRSSFAIARMVGVTGAQLFRHLLLEALVLGVMGSVFGVLLGILLGQGLLILVAQTINDLYVQVQARDLLIAPLLLLKGVGITLFSVLLATLAPALEAARVAPVQVKRQSSLESTQQRMSGSLAVLGVLNLLLSLLLIESSGKSLAWGFVGLFGLIIGYSLIIPWFLRISLQVLQHVKRLHCHLLLRMALRGVQASLSRTALAIIALSVAVSATVGVSLMIASFRGSVATWLEHTLSSDLYVSAVAPGESKVQGTVNPLWLEHIKRLPEVASLSTGLSTQVPLDGVPIPALVLAPAAHNAQGFEYLAGEPRQVWQAFVQGKGVLVSEPLAYHRSIKLGQTITLQTDHGLKALPVLAIYRDYSATQGMLVIPRLLFERYWQDTRISSIGLKLKPDADAAVIEQQLQGLAAQIISPSPISIRSSKNIREFSLQIFDRTFAITNVLRLLVIVVAFIGVFSALMALFLEKGREYAILRATGFTPQQLSRLVFLQAAIMGLFAGLLALPLGSIMSLVLIDIINQRSFGWTMHTQFFASVPLQAIALALLAACLASLYPVKRLNQLVLRQAFSQVA
jgi:putative ABC transport system permease protein